MKLCKICVSDVEKVFKQDSSMTKLPNLRDSNSDIFSAFQQLTAVQKDHFTSMPLFSASEEV